MALETSQSKEETLAALRRIAKEDPRMAERVERIIEGIERGESVDLEDFELIEADIELCKADELAARVVTNEELLTPEEQSQREQQYKALKAYGQLQEIIVYADSGEYRVVDGMSRVRDAARAGLPTLRAKLFPSRNAALLAALVEGYRRPRTGVDLLRHLRVVERTHKVTQEVIAQSLGISTGRVSQLQAHLDSHGNLKPDFRELVEQGCSETVATELLCFAKGHRHKIVADWKEAHAQGKDSFVKTRWPTKAFLSCLKLSSKLQYAYFMQGLPLHHTWLLVKRSDLMNDPEGLDKALSFLKDKGGWCTVSRLKNLGTPRPLIEEVLPSYRDLIDGHKDVKDMLTKLADGNYGRAKVVRVVRREGSLLRIDLLDG